MTHDEAFGILAAIAIMHADQHGHVEATPERFAWAKAFFKVFRSRYPEKYTTGDNPAAWAMDMAIEINPTEVSANG